MDPESAEWIRALSGDGDEREAAVVRLHERLVAVARRETRRRHTSPAITGPELDDLADQAADDALLAVLAKLPTFRGESRFTTWAYRFVMLEVSHRLGRHHWRHARPHDAHDWDRFPDRFGLDPHRHAEAAELAAAVRDAVEARLTPHQREVFVSAVVDEVPLDALAERMGVTRGAVYKALFDARRNLREALVEQGHLEAVPSRRRARKGVGVELDRFLRTDPADVGCEEALRLLHVYADLVSADRRGAERRYPGIVAHLAACGPCGDDYAGLLTAISGDPGGPGAPEGRPEARGRRFLRRRPRSGR